MIDPRAFAGLDAFQQQMDAVTAQCRASKPTTLGQTVRTPGERGLNLKAQSAQTGVSLYPTVMPMLSPWADKLKVSLPNPWA
jgi:L-lactate dehydrogenase